MFLTVCVCLNGLTDYIKLQLCLGHLFRMENMSNREKKT